MTQLEPWEVVMRSNITVNLILGFAFIAGFSGWATRKLLAARVENKKKLELYSWLASVGSIAVLIVWLSAFGYELAW